MDLDEVFHSSQMDPESVVETIEQYIEENPNTENENVSFDMNDTIANQEAPTSDLNPGDDEDFNESVSLPPDQDHSETLQGEAAKIKVNVLSQRLFH